MSVPLLAVGIMDLLTSVPGIIAVVLFLLLGTAIGYASRYKRCASNRILVIYGQVSGGRSATCIHGGGRFVWPVVQDYAFLSLEPIQIEVPLQDALSSENIRVNVPSVFTVAIGTQPEVMQNAAIRLLDLDTSAVKKQAEDIIFGQMRQVIASMRIEDINRDRELFLTQIQTSLEPELKKIGLVLINVNITDITDESGYIEAIGRKAASEAVQKARGDVAEEEKLGEVRVAQAEREKLVEVANAHKLQHIGVREADREQAVRIAELAKEQVVGEQEALFLQEIAVAKAEQQKRISVADANSTAMIGEKEALLQQESAIANAEQKNRVSVAEFNATAIAGEAESAAKVANANAELQFKEAEAYELGETKKREAEAAVQEAQNRAMAKAALADAERVEAEHRAELEAPAKAEKAKRIVEAEAESERIRLEAEGEAAAIFSKLEAQAKGEYEILAAKGKGLQSIIDACGGAEPAFRMMMLEHMDNLAESSAKAISNIKFDKVVVWENGANANGESSTSGFLQGLSRSMPPMMHVMKDIAGVEMPEFLAKFSDAEQATAADETPVSKTDETTQPK